MLRNCIVQSVVKTGIIDTIFSLDALNLVVEKNKQKKLKSIPSFKWESENIFRYSNDSKVFRFNMLTRELTIVNSFDSEGENSEFEPSTGRIAFTKTTTFMFRRMGKPWL